MTSLHTILQLKDTPHGKQICYQEVTALLCCCQYMHSLREVLCQNRWLEHTLVAVQGTRGERSGQRLQPAAQFAYWRVQRGGSAEVSQDSECPGSSQAVRGPTCRLHARGAGGCWHALSQRTSGDAHRTMRCCWRACCC